MDERAIIIADRDAEYRSQIAEHFEKAGYRVETTDSAAHVLCSILEKRSPVLLLGHDFDQKIGTAELIHLLKKCNRHLHVIMVSDQMPLCQVRRVRQEGIFYHALKPALPGDTEELGQAVRCAFEKSRDTDGKKGKVPEPGGNVGVEEPVVVQDAPIPSGQVLPGLICLAAAIFGGSYLALAAAERAGEGKMLGLWLFLAFCALLLATQLLPVFGIRLPLRRAQDDQTKQEHGSLD